MRYVLQVPHLTVVGTVQPLALRAVLPVACEQAFTLPAGNLHRTHKNADTTDVSSL